MDTQLDSIECNSLSTDEEEPDSDCEDGKFV